MAQPSNNTVERCCKAMSQCKSKALARDGLHLGVRVSWSDASLHAAIWQAHHAMPAALQLQVNAPDACLVGT